MNHRPKQLLAAGLALAFSSLATAATLSFQEGVSPSGSFTVQDVQIRASESAVNQNAQPLIVGRNTSGAIRSLLQFDLSALETAIGSNSFTIDSVSLVLHQSSSLATNTTTSYTFELQRYDFSFDETTATWASPGTGDSTAGGTTGTLLSSTSFTVASSNTLGSQDIFRTFGTTAAFTSAITDVLSGPGSSIGFRVIAPELQNLTGNQFVRFDSSEVATASFRPELIINYTSTIPEPSTYAALAGLGALGFVAQRRRRRA